VIKLTDILLEQENILVPRRSKEERQKNYRIVTQKKIQQYIKGGSEGDLNLMGSPIEKLPDNLKVGGNLSLSNTPIKELPDNLKVGGILDLSNTPIKELPDNLEVGRNLYLKNTQIEKLPDNLEVGGFLGLRNTPLSKKYTKLEIKDLIEEKGGYVKNNIFT